MTTRIFSFPIQIGDQQQLFAFSTHIQTDSNQDITETSSKNISVSELKMQLISLSSEGNIKEALKLELANPLSNIAEKEITFLMMAKNYKDYLETLPAIEFKHLAQLQYILDLTPYTGKIQGSQRRLLRVFIIEQACKIQAFDLSLSCFTILCRRDDSFLKKAGCTLLDALFKKNDYESINQILKIIPFTCKNEQWFKDYSKAVHSLERS